MNKICRTVESEFDNFMLNDVKRDDFDYTFLKYGYEYSQWQYDNVAKIYTKYTRRLQELAKRCSEERVDDDERVARRIMLITEFDAECSKTCSNEQLLCDIILDICYNRETTKQFCWDMCVSAIIENLLKQNGGIIHYPTEDPTGEILFNGKNYSIEERVVTDDGDGLE